MNCYSPYFDSDDNCARMERDLDGSWVHVEALEAALMERDAARDAAEGLQATLKEREALLTERERKLEEAKLLLSVQIGTVEAQRQLLADNGVLLLKATAEVERLREVVRHVHTMTGRGVDWPTFPEEAATALRAIHKLTGEAP